MTVFGEPLFSLIYYPLIKHICFERRLEAMNHFFKGVIVIAAVMIVNMVLHIICNRNGVDLNSTVTGTVSAVSAMLIYHGWIRNEK